MILSIAGLGLHRQCAPGPSRPSCSVNSPAASPVTGSHHLILSQGPERLCSSVKSAPPSSDLLNMCHRGYFSSPAFIFNICAPLSPQESCECEQILLVSGPPRDGSQTCPVHPSLLQSSSLIFLPQ